MTEAQKEYIITGERLKEMQRSIDRLIAYGAFSKDELEQFTTINGILKSVRSRPYKSEAVLEPIGMNSTDILLLAHDEWKRREERKHNHPEEHWVPGFINGFLTDKKWGREYVKKLRQQER